MKIPTYNTKVKHIAAKRGCVTPLADRTLKPTTPPIDPAMAKLIPHINEQFLQTHPLNESGFPVSDMEALSQPLPTQVYNAIMGSMKPRSSTPPTHNLSDSDLIDRSLDLSNIPPTQLAGQLETYINVLSLSDSDISTPIVEPQTPTPNDNPTPP